MNNLLRKVQVDDDVVLLNENRYDESRFGEYLEAFGKMEADGKIRSGFDDHTWIYSSQIKTFEIPFVFSATDYKRHFGKVLKVPPSEAEKMLKCWVISVCGEYIFRTIALKVKAIAGFLTRFGDGNFRLEPGERTAVIDFLSFAGFDVHETTEISAKIGLFRTPKAQKRELANLVNYLAVDSELTDIYSSPGLTDEEFILWFPLFFWAKVTFVLPLRATEMLVTPFGCIRRKDGEVYLTVRRTRLKGAAKTVFYEVGRDYGLFEYRIPDSFAVKIIERYQKLTAGHERRFLFDYGWQAVNGVMSLASFNALLAEFINEKLIGNRKYDYARYTCGIKEFQTVTAGDSRPIAMANLYYQDAGADICRQLANHASVSVSAGYYTNVSETVLASSVMRLQRKINSERADLERYGAPSSSSSRTDVLPYGCLSPRRPFVTGDVADCIAENHIQECLGCRYYRPGGKELAEALEKRKKALDEASLNVLKCMSEGTDRDGTDFEKIFLDAHTGAARYRTACDENAKGKLEKWRRLRNTQTTCS